MGRAPPLTPSQVLAFQKYFLVGYWVETSVYGVYALLFGIAVRAMLNSRGSKAILAGTVAMFGMITFQNFTSLYSMIGAYGKNNDPISYLRNLTTWDGYAFPVTLAIITWIGDIIVIYRCFLIWNKTYAVIALPVIILLACIAVTSVNFVWFRDFESIPWSAMDHILKITYPLNFSQNVITTGLITFKIYREHRLSVLAFREDLSGEKKDVITTPSGLNFVTVIQIIVESAVIYTILMGLLIILIAVDYHPSQVILQHLVAPITGIVFVMIALRTHAAKRAENSIHGANNNGATASLCPTWLSGNDDLHVHPFSSSCLSQTDDGGVGSQPPRRSGQRDVSLNENHDAESIDEKSLDVERGKTFK